MLQPRFEQRVQKRVFRLLAHPRFRAAYDFLVLRSTESPALAELSEWWTQAQSMDHPALAQLFTPTPAPTPESLGEKTGTKRKRPRRRRRKKAAPSDAGAASE